MIQRLKQGLHWLKWACLQWSREDITFALLGIVAAVSIVWVTKVEDDFTGVRRIPIEENKAKEAVVLEATTSENLALIISINPYGNNLITTETDNKTIIAAIKKKEIVAGDVLEIGSATGQGSIEATQAAARMGAPEAMRRPVALPPTLKL